MHEEEHYLTSLFEPKSVAVIGASDRENSVGNIIYRNIVAAGYKGRLYPINPKHDTVQGVQAYKSIEEIGARVDLAVIATQARTVPAIIEQCGRSGVKNVVVITAGFAEAGHSGAALERKMVEIARSYGVRILGPNCLGLIRPVQGLNATFANISANPGNLALVSQSGALCTAILDWAKVNDVGFSSVISTGGSADIDFGEILDYLVYDNRTHYILMYVEGIRNARRFMSAMRSAARIKPILLLKAGRYESGSVAAQVHSGMALGSDAVFDAALKRAGVVRVRNIGQLFYAAKGLASKFRPDGNKLLIITNGGGPGAMAADRAAELGIPLADLSQSTIASSQCGAAAHLVPRQPHRHRRRCHPGTLPGRHPGRHPGPGGGRHPGDADAPGHDPARGSGQGRDHPPARPVPSPSSAAGWANSRPTRRARC